LRVLLVEVDPPRPLLAGFVVIRNREDALEPVAVLVLEIEELPVAPQELCLLRVGVGDLLRVLEPGTRDAEVGELDERLPREEELVGVRRLERCVERGILVNELTQSAVRQLVVPRLLRPVAVRGQQDGFRQIDRLFPPAAAASAESSAWS